MEEIISVDHGHKLIDPIDCRGIVPTDEIPYTERI
jgi:hypothetical protein